MQLMMKDFLAAQMVLLGQQWLGKLKDRRVK